MKLLLGIIVGIPLAVVSALAYDRLFGMPGLPLIPDNLIGQVLTLIGIAAFVVLVALAYLDNRHDPYR